MAVRVCVAGVGAVGSAIAARLAVAGEAVSLFARGPRLRQLRRDGLRVQFPDLSVQERLNVSDAPEFGVQDILFVAVKAHGVAALLPALSPLIGSDTVVVPLLNGIPWWYFQKTGGAFRDRAVRAVDPAGVLGRAIDVDRIVGSVVYITARQDTAGIVSAAGGQRLMVGELTHTHSTRRSRCPTCCREAASPPGPVRRSATTYGPRSP